MVMACIDLDSLNELREVMGDEFPLLIETFITDSDTRVHSIQQAVVAADPEAIRRAAHGLKGSASNMGAVALAQLCRDLENLAYTGSNEDAQLLADQIEHQYGEAKTLLNAL